MKIIAAYDLTYRKHGILYTPKARQTDSINFGVHQGTVCSQPLMKVYCDPKITTCMPGISYALGELAEIHTRVL